MLPRNSFAALAIAATMVASSAVWAGDEQRGASYQADQYLADEFLGLDLSKAALSPRPLGPAASFTPGPLDVTVDRESNRAHAEAETMVPAAVVAPKPVVPKAVVPKTVVPKTVVRSAQAVHPGAAPVRQVRQATPPRLLARTKFAGHPGNPLDAHASDPRIQVWPCRSGGICNWKR
jgi:hypothetical protein